MDWILSRELMITMASLGAAASVLATLPGIRSAGLARSLNLAGYVLMGASMLVFIIIGLRSG
jgi:predicted membrane channel-forming protein YqfA (hemolysin III family)